VKIKSTTLAWPSCRVIEHDGDELSGDNIVEFIESIGVGIKGMGCTDVGAVCAVPAWFNKITWRK
jgi:hypothetical protein